MAKKIKSLEDLTPDVANANKGNERGIYMVETSLEKLGAGRSIVVDRDGNVIAGNKTLQAAIEKGFDIEVVPTDGKKLVVVQRQDLDLNDPDGQARQLAYADNRAGEVGLEWDIDRLVSDLAIGIELDDWFKADELDALIGDIVIDPPQDAGAQVDRASELQDVWQVERGQVWEIPSKTVEGKCHRVMCGDSTSAEDVAVLMGGEKAKLFATDPPYGVAYGVETGNNVKYDAIANDENDGERLQAFLENCFTTWLAYLEPNAAWYLWHAQLTQGFFAAAAAAAANIIIHRQIIWVKPSLILGHGHYHWRHELCFYGWQRGNEPDWYGDRSQTTVWEVGRENDGVHPTQKPAELFTKPMVFNTLKGNICADPFLGSGTTLVACEQTGRVGYGMEIEPKYIAVTLQRLSDMGLEPSEA